MYTGPFTVQRANIDMNPAAFRVDGTTNRNDLKSAGISTLGGADPQL